jgi:hypothetical protein
MATIVCIYTALCRAIIKFVLKGVVESTYGTLHVHTRREETFSHLSIASEVLNHYLSLIRNMHIKFFGVLNYGTISIESINARDINYLEQINIFSTSMKKVSLRV